MCGYSDGIGFDMRYAAYEWETCMSHIIFLHGASSSGKSTIAKELQSRIEVPFWHISIDHLRDSGVLSAPSCAGMHLRASPTPSPKICPEVARALSLRAVGNPQSQNAGPRRSHQRLMTPGNHSCRRKSPKRPTSERPASTSSRSMAASGTELALVNQPLTRTTL